MTLAMVIAVTHILPWFRSLQRRLERVRLLEPATIYMDYKILFSGGIYTIDVEECLLNPLTSL